MMTLHFFWAGQLVGTWQATSEDSCDDLIQELKSQLTSQTLTHISCGTLFAVQELCVDIIKSEILIGMVNLKV